VLIWAKQCDYVIVKRNYLVSAQHVQSVIAYFLSLCSSSASTAARCWRITLPLGWQLLSPRPPQGAAAGK